MFDTHDAWRQLNVEWRLQHDACSVAIVRPGDRETYRNSNRKDDPYASFQVLERDLGRDAACLHCERPLQNDADAVGIVITPEDADLEHLAEAYFLCEPCARDRDDDGIIALIGGAA